MTTFAEDILETANGEPVEAIVIGGFGWGSSDETDAEAYGFGRGERAAIGQTMKNRVLTWAQAQPLLSYNYDRGYGAPDCHAITAWTKSHVIFVTQYDGSTSIDWVPRNPVDHKPNMPGG